MCVCVCLKNPVATFLLYEEVGDDGLVLKWVHGMGAEYQATADSKLSGTGVQHSTHATSQPTTQHC